MGTAWQYEFLNCSSKGSLKGCYYRLSKVWKSLGPSWKNCLLDTQTVPKEHSDRDKHRTFMNPQVGSFILGLFGQLTWGEDFGVVNVFLSTLY